MAEPDVVSAYTAAMTAARTAGFRLSAQAVARLQAALAAAARQIEFELDVSDNPVTQARGQALRAQILELLAAFRVELGRTTARAVGLTYDQIIGIHRRVVERLSQAALGGSLPGLAGQFDQLALRAATVIAARTQNAAAFRTLINRHIEEVAPALDQLLTGAIARGVSTGRLTKDVAALLRDGIARTSLRDYGVAEADVTGLASIDFDARRIAVSETMNALREANNASLQLSPIVLAVRWQRSGRHAGLRSSPDECDVLAEVDWYGFGPGYFSPGAWPLAPHSLCACVQGGPTIFRRPSEWGQPKPAPPGLASSPDAAPWEDVLAATVEWTPLRRQRAIEVVTASLGRVPPGRRRRAA